MTTYAKNLIIEWFDIFTMVRDEAHNRRLDLSNEDMRNITTSMHIELNRRQGKGEAIVIFDEPEFQPAEDIPQETVDLRDPETPPKDETPPPQSPPNTESGVKKGKLSKGQVNLFHVATKRCRDTGNTKITDAMKNLGIEKPEDLTKAQFRAIIDDPEIQKLLENK